jgi:serine/threonine protein kinase
VTRGEDKTGTEKAWDAEASALANVNAIDHDHIVKCVAAIRRGDDRYFMFPWANGESLRDYWNTADWQQPDRASMSQALHQLRGLADALVTLHDGVRTHVARSGNDHAGQNGESQELFVEIRDENGELTDHFEPTNPNNIRHGDLKPENILRFLGNSEGLGTLRLADMGLAKQHIVATSDRKHLTSTRYGTVRYEAPEAVSDLKAPRSRLYDIWSMGCVMLEFLIWMLYGNEELKTFHLQVQGGDEQQLCQFFEMLTMGEIRRAEIHPVVLAWMNHIESADPECQREESATKDLINIIREKLLVVPLPPNRASSTVGGRAFAPPQLGQTTTRYRATALQLRNALDEILAKETEPKYMFGTNDRSAINPPRLRASGRAAHTARDQGKAAVERPLESNSHMPTGVLTGMSNIPMRPANYTLPPMENWVFDVDVAFAETVLNEVGAQAMLPTTDTRTKLCNRCHKLEFWAADFKIVDKFSALTQRATICDFCKLISKACEGNEAIQNDRVRIERRQSTLVVAGEKPFPVLSIVRSPGKPAHDAS